METINIKKCAVEPIRGSVFILAVKYILLLFIFDGIYELIYYFLNVQFLIPYDFHHHLSVGFFILLITKFIIQAYLIMFITLSWANNMYYLTDKYLVKKSGILGRNEEKYLFDAVFSTSINRSFAGQIFGYGDLQITVNAGNDKRELILSGIADPFKYEQMLKECCKNLKTNNQEIVFNKK